MAIEDSKFYIFYNRHRKILHFIEGVLIIFIISMLWISLNTSNKLQEEISENCGWGKEDYQCYCQKEDALALKSELEGRELNVTINNVDR